MDTIETVKETLEHAHAHAHGHAAHGAPHGEEDARLTRIAAIVAASFAAIAVIAEMNANHAQTGYLAEHIRASDIWAQYQAKSVRRVVYQETAVQLENSGTPGDATHKAIETARAEAARMQSEPGKDGMTQLSDRARAAEGLRDVELVAYEQFEKSALGLQIAVVLSGLFLVTRFKVLLGIAVLLGLAGTAWTAWTMLV